MDNFEVNDDEMPGDAEEECEDAEDMSGVKDVNFGDPQLMDPEGGIIEEFLKAHPYQEFDYICRKLRLPPAEALKRIKTLVEVIGTSSARNRKNDRFCASNQATEI